MTHNIPISMVRLALAAAVITLQACGAAEEGQPDATTMVDDNVAGPVYPTYGVHNPPRYSPCEHDDCLYTRGPDEPADPRYPEYWSTEWTMYRVFNGYEDYPPPYDGRPPEALREMTDYEVSYGATYYDDSWRGPTGEGAMMEHYVDRCLPIFPISNRFTCSFISVGDVAYFLTYEQDRPEAMPPACLFSNLNHPPRRDFIKHLPYSLGDSERLGGIVQGYSFWIDHETGAPVQVGVSPDLTADSAIMFGYAFMSQEAPDAVDADMAPYRRPQSFYFSGSLDSLANAPIVSQNYTGFSATRPDPTQTWDLVAGLSPDTTPACDLFPERSQATSAEAASAPSWHDIGRN